MTHQQFMQQSFNHLGESQRYIYLERIGMLIADQKDVPDEVHQMALEDAMNYLKPEAVTARPG